MITANKKFSQTTIAQFMYKVYAWMCAGLCITAVTSYSLFLKPELLYPLLANHLLFYALFLLQIGLVAFLTLRINRISYTTASVAFVTYSTLIGITLTPIFLIYTLSSIGLAFGITAAMFGSMALYGYYTNDDLSKLRSILLMGLWGLIIAMLANWYFQSTQMQYIISCAAVLLFTLLTAYDVQKIKRIAFQFQCDPYQKENKTVLLCALTLYLDFINLFLHILKLMGKKKK